MWGIKMKMEVVLAPLHTTRKKLENAAFRFLRSGLPSTRTDPLLESMFKAYNEPNGLSLKIS